MYTQRSSRARMPSSGSSSHIWLAMGLRSPYPARIPLSVQPSRGLPAEAARPPPPHSGVGGTACVFPKSPVKGYFSCDKVRPENCKKKKGGYLTFTRRFLLKRGWFFFLSLFGRMRNLKGGYKIKYRGYIEQFFGLRGVSKAAKSLRKACEKPAKGGFRIVSVRR